MEIFLIIAGIIVGLAIYFNLSYYFVMSFRDTCFSHGKKNFVQKFQLGPKSWCYSDKDNIEICTTFTYFLWPICLVIQSVAWIGYYLVKYVLGGGFVELLENLNKK